MNGTPVVYFSGEIFRLQKVGGISRYIVEMHRHLSATGVGSIIGQYGSISTMINDRDTTVGSCSIPNQNRSRGAAFLSRSLANLQERRGLRKQPSISILHRSYFGSPWRTKLATVTTVYDLVAYKTQYGFPDRQTHHMERCIRDASHLFAISESTRTDLVEMFGIDQDRITTIPLGTTRPSSSELFDIPMYGDYVLFVGNRSGYKNWRRFAQAFAVSECKEMSIVCVGGGSPSPDELAWLSECGIRKSRVHFENATDDRLGALYRGAICLAFISEYEGFGLPLLEAMARMCPVVTSNLSSMPEVAGDAAILVDPFDVESIADGLNRVLDARTREALLALGFERSMQFTWEAAAARAAVVYRELTG
jgi:glycosyltransferase involved in cell wall biosynthesis